MQQRSQETRDQLLTAAADAFGELGYDGTGVAEICRRANVSKGAFYHHFASKRALFLELLAEWLNLLDAQLHATLDQARSVPAALTTMAAQSEAIFQEAHGRLPLFLAFWAEAVRDPETWASTIAPYRHYQHFFARMLRQSAKDGHLQPGDPEMAARVLISLAAGVLLQGVFDPDGADWAQVMRTGIATLLQGWEVGGINAHTNLDSGVTPDTGA